MYEEHIKIVKNHKIERYINRYIQTYNMADSTNNDNFMSWRDSVAVTKSTPGYTNPHLDACRAVRRAGKQLGFSGCTAVRSPPSQPSNPHLDACRAVRRAGKQLGLEGCTAVRASPSPDGQNTIITERIDQMAVNKAHRVAQFNQKRQVEHLSWLLSEAYDEIGSLRNATDYTQSNSCRDSEYSMLCQTFSNNIYSYGFPTYDCMWDDYYDGRWMKCSWGDETIWFWMGNSMFITATQQRHPLQRVVKKIVNRMFWNTITNGEPTTEDYTWDEHYNGWWVQSQWNNTDVEDSWIWTE